MKLDRRAFLGALPLAAASYFYLHNEPMTRAPPINGMVAADLHAHIPLPKSRRELEEILREAIGRVIGFTYKRGHNIEYLSYDALTSLESPTYGLLRHLLLSHAIRIMSEF